MTKLTPFSSFAPLFRWPFVDDRDSLLRRFWNDEDAPTAWSPSAEIVEKPEAYIVTVEVPGMKAEDIHVDLTGNTLTVHGERKHEEKKRNEHYQLYERRYGSFHRTFTFPAAVHADNVEADLKEGVLTLNVMKVEEGKPAKIKVKAH